MIRYTPERGYGLDLSGPEPVWRGKRQGWNENAGKWVLDCGNDYWLHNEGRGVVRLTSRYGNTEQFAAYKAALLALGCVEVPSAR